MTKYVRMRGPDGTIAHIPEDRVEDAIEFGARVEPEKEDSAISALSNPSGKKSSVGIFDPLKENIRLVGRVGRAAATGISGIADIPNLAAMGLHAAGLKETPTFYEPIASKVQNQIDTLTGGKLKPRNKFEEYGDIIGEGLAPMALAPLTGGASLSGTAAKGLAKTGVKVPSKISKLGAATYKPTAANIAQSAGSSAALKAYIDQGGDPGILEALLASSAGGIGARKALQTAKIVKNPIKATAELGREFTGKLTGFSPEKYAQNVEIGLPVSLGTVSKSQIPGYAEMIAAKMPGSMGPLEKFYKKREAAISRNLGIQNTDDLEKAVENIPKYLAKEGAERYHKRASDIYKKREKKFKQREEEAILNKETIDVSDIIDKLEHERELSLTPSAKNRFDKSKEGILLKELKESVPQNLSDDYTSSIAKQLHAEGYPQEIINKIIKSEKESIEETGKGIGLHDLNKLREKALHESLSLQSPTGAGTPQSKNAAERHQMLSSKRHEFIEQTGTPLEIHNARQARKFWSQYKDKKNGMSEYVAKLTGSDNDADAFNKLTGHNPKYLNIARQGLNKKDQNALATGIVANMGSRQGRFNINTAHTSFSNMETPVKKELLKTFPNKSAQVHFERTMKLIGENKRFMEKLANTSNTSHSKHMLDQMKRYGTAAVAAATGANFVGLLGLAVGTASLYGGAHLWTNQNFLKRVNDAIVASNKTAKFNKLDLFVKSIEQTGIHTKHLDENKYERMRDQNISSAFIPNQKVQDALKFVAKLANSP